MRRSSRIRTAVTVVAAIEPVAAIQATGPRQKALVASVGKRSLSVSSESTKGAKKIKTEDLKVKTEVLQHEPNPNAIKRATSEAPEWRDLCPTQELSCLVTLTSGQVFTWKQYAPESHVWIGVVGTHVYKLRERDHRVQYQLVHPPHLSTEQANATLHEYFRLEVEAAPLYAQWSEKDDDMSKVIRSLPGLRIIRQDPVECLFAFICSSNNNIQRITQMVTKLKATYGEKLYHDPVSNEPFFAFPSVQNLATRADEQTLRDLGFGYRAPFIIKSSALLKELGGLEYMMALRASERDGAYADKLMAFSGVGRKVADCIGLFSLDKLDAIPVDTHVWQIACREFDASLKNKKSLTPTVYQAVGDHFRSRFSPLAGWAHSVLFAGDLSSFQTHLPEEMQQKKKSKAKAKGPKDANANATSSRKNRADSTDAARDGGPNQKRKRKS